MAIRQSTGRGRVFLRQRNLPASWADLVRRHMGGPSSSNPLGDAGHELGAGGLPLRGGPIGQRLLRLERRYEAEERGLSRPGRRSRVPQPDLVLLLDRVREKGNPNARASNGDTHAATLSSTANRDTDGSSNCDDDSYLDAHLSGYGHGHAKFHCHLDAHLSGYEHGHSAALAEQLTDKILA